uniref:Uncharacterized protein n=1 Tax=Strongyloides venezuelensis TaxID=75913 RepID=A0A0K0FQE8_STRVS
MNFFTNIKTNIFIVLIISILFLQFVENAAKKKNKSLTTTTRSSKKNTSSKRRKTTRGKKENMRKKSHKRRRPSKNKYKKLNFLNVAMPRSRFPFNAANIMFEKTYNISRREGLDKSDPKLIKKYGRKK